MKKLLKRALPLLLSIALLIGSVPFAGMVSADPVKFTSTEFDYATQADFDAVWETVVGNYRTSATPSASVAPAITTTEDGRTAISAALSGTRASMMTTIKSDYFITGKRIEKVTAKMKVDTLTTGALKNADSAPGIYAMHLNNYKSAVLQLGDYYNKDDAEDANNGYITLQWNLFYDNGTTTTTNGCSASIVDADNKNTRKNTTLNADDWITITITYDYSDISNNSLSLSALLEDESGNSYTAACRVAFDESGNNAYSDGFKVGLSSTGSNKLPTYYDYFAIEYQKGADDYASDFNTKYKKVLDADSITSEEDYNTVLTAIAEYETLSDEVKALLGDSLTKLNTLKNGYLASNFSNQYADILNLSTVSTNAQFAKVLEAIAAYNELDDDVKAGLTDTLAKLNTLKATFKLTSDDFENEALFNEVYETLPEGSEYIYSATEPTGTVSMTADATLIAAPDNSENTVILPAISNFNRKRYITLPKAAYLKNVATTSFSADMYIDASATFDNNAGLYLYYVDIYNYVRLEIQSSNNRVRFGYSSGNAEEKTASTKSQVNLTESVMDKWLTANVTYTYAESDLTIAVTLIDKSSQSEIYSGTYTVSSYDDAFRVGYGAGTKNNNTYYDNFAITYAASADDFLAEHSDALALTTDTVAIKDKAIVMAAIEAYNSTSADIKAELADEYALLVSLKSKIANLEAKNGLLTEDFENGFDNWEIVNDEGEEGGLVANPVKDSVNSSDNALAADGTNRASTAESLANNFTIYKLKNSVVDGAQDIASVSGKLYIKASNYVLTFITEYTDSDNYAGLMISIGGFDTSFDAKYAMTARAIKYVDGVGTQYANASDVVHLINENYNGSDYGWYYFTLDYTDTGYRLRITDEKGISKNDAYFEMPISYEYSNATADTKDIVFTGENRIFALSARSSSGNSVPYFDDLEIAFANSDYAAAAEFLKDYTSVLRKDTKNIAPVDGAKITVMVNAYNALSDAAKTHLDIADVVSALDSAKWGNDVATEYTAKYSSVINGEINADNVAQFEEAWNILNRLDAATQAQLKDLRATLVSKLTSYSGTLNLTDKIRVTVIGDSITYGYGISGTSAKAWPAKLQSALGDNYDIKNFAISGYKVVNNYANGGVQYLTDTYRSDRLIGLQQDTDIVIIALGVNDSVHLATNTKARYAMLLNGYIELINSFLENTTCSTVIVSGAMWDTDGKGDAYNTEVNKAAKEACTVTGAKFVDLYSYVEEIFNANEESITTYLQSDKLHYTEAGEQVVADFFYDYFTTKQEKIFVTENASYFDDYIQEVIGASIKKSNEEGQDIRFSATFGRIRSDKTVKAYGMIITLRNYITNGYVNISDMTVANAADNKYIKMASSTNVENVVEGNTFYASVGGVIPDMYGRAYTMRIFVEYTDGTIDYSDTMDRSVIGVAKSILTWVYENYDAIDTEYGVADYTTLFTAINGNGKFTWVAGATDNNGKAILDYLADNNVAITNALNGLN